MQKDRRASELMDVMDLMRKDKMSFRSKSHLRGAQISILNCIFDNTNDTNNEIKPSQISTFMNLQQPSISPILKDLEHLGFINRRNDDVDRRQVYYGLTKKGSVIVKEYREHELELFGGLAEYLGDEDTDKFVEILKKVMSYMRSRNTKCSDNAGGKI